MRFAVVLQLNDKQWKTGRLVGAGLLGLYIQCLQFGSLSACFECDVIAFNRGQVVSLNLLSGQFAVYEAVRRKERENWGKDPKWLPGVSRKVPVSTVAGATAGLASTLVIYPLNTLMDRLLLQVYYLYFLWTTTWYMCLFLLKDSWSKCLLALCEMLVSLVV